MRFIFLGTGTSSGVPAIGCECAVCRSDDPRDQRLRCGAALVFTDPRGQQRVLLIDATPDLRTQALRARLSRCDAILFTHNHVDHTFGLDEVRRFNAVQKAPIDVFAEPHTMGHLRRVYQHIFEREHNVNDSFVATLVARTLTPGQPIDLFGVTVTPVRLLHGNLPILGFRFDAPNAAGSSPFPLAYLTDVSGIPPETYAHLSGLGTLVIDALRHRAHPTHLTLAKACEIAGNIGPRRTWFTHMAHDLPHAETNAALPPEMQLAHDGLELA
jgi:phosphoribosyl 1,2-cyclic phosphate phosphodiesterase